MSVSWWQPLIGTTWQWQLSGSLDTSVPTTIYDIDVAGGASIGAVKAVDLNRKVICYVN
ncbi:UNVERIFIED_CONTAM: hypothetical protein HDU68_006760, partial [Siphonaria sp. JEL0065]